MKLRVKRLFGICVDQYDLFASIRNGDPYFPWLRCWPGSFCHSIALISDDTSADGDTQHAVVILVINTGRIKEALCRNAVRDFEGFILRFFDLDRLNIILLVIRTYGSSCTSSQG
ncbi:hypothetical protein Xgly_02140 [Xanthomonas citri pv. glycines]|uniref:Uncharacterized protein n=1 Tax=Xanthomonas campestris pv. glycines TaxID=473421 RepID=A0AAX0HUP0_XANCG|nr:hypothetical protein A9D66_03175 [Xanthomonas citri pv. glycines str. 12-2]OEY88335.1 hypothetical protein BIY41_03130 [Xanthomonas citri pv. glycines]OOX01003.1 hypothetical protein Xgly_02140 [Xanthomonas citri pv. glycines]